MNPTAESILTTFWSDPTIISFLSQLPKEHQANVKALTNCALGYGYYSGTSFALESLVSICEKEN